MIKYLNLTSYNNTFRPALDNAITAVLDDGRMIGGAFVTTFENEYAKYCGVAFCVGTANGMDALTLILKGYIALGVLNENDEVLVPANTFIATIFSILQAGLRPKLIDPNPETYVLDVDHIINNEQPDFKAIIGVHLYGRLVDDFIKLRQYCDSKNILLIADAAQAHGAIDSQGNRAGAIAHAASFSFYPGKNLGAIGDAGCVTTNDEVLATILRKIGNYGASKKYHFQYQGLNSRLDPIQAAVLSLKLNLLDNHNAKRKAVAQQFNDGIVNPKIELPIFSMDQSNVWHVYPVLVNDRIAFQQHMKENGVEALIHYPIAPHQQEALKQYKKGHYPITENIHEREVSLPCNPMLTPIQIEKIIQVVNSY